MWPFSMRVKVEREPPRFPPLPTPPPPEKVLRVWCGRHSPDCWFVKTNHDTYASNSGIRCPAWFSMSHGYISMASEKFGWLNVGVALWLDEHAEDTD